jgi:hypothetical protein
MFAKRRSLLPQTSNRPRGRLKIIERNLIESVDLRKEGGSGGIIPMGSASFGTIRLRARNPRCWSTKHPEWSSSSSSLASSSPVNDGAPQENAVSTTLHSYQHDPQGGDDPLARFARTHTQSATTCSIVNTRRCHSRCMYSLNKLRHRFTVVKRLAKTYCVSVLQENLSIILQTLRRLACCIFLRS